MSRSGSDDQEEEASSIINNNNDHPKSNSKMQKSVRLNAPNKDSVRAPPKSSIRASSSSNQKNYQSSLRAPPRSSTAPYRRRRSSVAASLRFYSRQSGLMMRETAAEVRRLNTSVRVSALLTAEAKRLTKERHLVFPEAPTTWDSFWITLLAIFVGSVVPGLFYFGSRRFPVHWTPLNQSMVVEDTPAFFNAHGGDPDTTSAITLHLYETAGYGVVTPLQKPMHSFFFLHVGSAFFASALLLVMFTTGRVMRWRLVDGTVAQDEADDLHRLLALFSAPLWTTIIATGFLTIPLLHPTLQVANYAEFAGVATMFVGALLSAYTRQWILHRLCTWGLIYSATASVFVGLSGRFLQAYSDWTPFEIKAMGYTVAFATPIVGMLHDILVELAKMRSSAKEDLRTVAAKRGYGTTIQSTRLDFTKQCRPFNPARGDKARRLSFWQHLTYAEDEAEFEARRSRPAAAVTASGVANHPTGQTSQRPGAGMKQFSERTLRNLNALYEYESSPSPTAEATKRLSADLVARGLGSPPFIESIAE